MKPPVWAMTEALIIKVRVLSTNAHGEEVESWLESGTARACSPVYPLSRSSVNYAQLRGIRATGECYAVGPLEINPLEMRVSVAGQGYTISDARVWDGFTLLLLEEV